MKILGRHISTKIFIPFIFIFFLIFISATLGIKLSQDRELISENNKVIKMSEDRFNQLENRDSSALNSVLKTIINNNEIKELFLKRDKDSLYNHNIDTFNSLKNIYGVTHWYFIDKEGRVFLRMHDKNFGDDLINRFTLNKAKDTQKVASGLELGQTAFALRVVEPYYDSAGELIGYMELGQEIDYFINELSNDTGASYAIMVEKDKINKEDYFASANNTGRTNYWDDNEDYVAISSTVDKNTNQYKAINKYLSKEYFLHSQDDNYIFGNVRVDKDTFTVGEFHIKDASGINIGSVFTAFNINDTIDSNNLTVFIVSLSIFALFIFSYTVYSIVMKKNIINPLNKITNDAEKSFRNNFESYIDAQADDEIGHLVSQFNSLFSEIKNSRLNVDRKVEEQTMGLQKQGKALEDQQAAILNILEDVEEEKDNVKKVANDLKKFQLAVNNASDHIVITDIDGVTIYANKAVERITGFGLPDVIGAKAGSKSLWGGLMDSDFYKKLWDTIKNKKKTFVGEVRNIRKNNDQYDAAISISPVFDNRADIIFFVGIERDITKEKDVDRAKTEFVSLASHQLRTPLSSINWYSEMLLDGDVGKLNDDQSLYVNEIYKGNQRMVELVNALLNVSRLELGTFSVEPEDVVIKDVIDSLIVEMSAMSSKKGIKIVKEISNSVPKKYKADKNLFRIIIQNYMSNAIKYTQEKGTVIIRVEKKNNDLIFSVKDNGYGVPSNQKDKIFTKLFRADNVRQLDTEGTGLGLYIIKQIVEACSGTVGFVSKENKGSTFFAILPSSGMKEKKGSKKID